MKTKGYKTVKDQFGHSLLIEWEQFPSLSEELAKKMASQSHLGIDCFREVELDFIKQHPAAIQEDKSLEAFKNLEGEKLEEAINERLRSLFDYKPSAFSEEMRQFMADSQTYFITIREESSDEILGFLTCYSGSGLPSGTYKITILAVEKNARRRGLGGFLVEAIDQAGINASNLLVSTRPTNQKAIKAYQKWGFNLDDDLNNNPPSHFVKGHWIHLQKGESEN